MPNSLASVRHQLECPRLPSFDVTDWDAIRHTFEACPESPLGQSWLPTLEPDFQPATARFGWQGSKLWLYAELQDTDIFSEADGPNQKMWMLGDALELFLKPPSGEAYYEFHITPNNHLLQLRFPSADAQASGGDWTRFHLTELLLHSETRVEPDRNRWCALVSLDFQDIETDLATLQETPLLFSVSRYDWTRGQNEPVISSTSPHQKAWFHRQEEWGELILLG